LGKQRAGKGRWEKGRWSGVGSCAVDEEGMGDRRRKKRHLISHLCNSENACIRYVSKDILN
jgi:hypothetical protein